MVSPAPPALAVRGLNVAYSGRPAIRDLDLEIAAGETVAMLGPSGSGKTSLLYAVAGFIEPSGGEIEIGGRRVADAHRHLPPEQRDLAFVFQHYALWPHLTALETAAYPLRRAGVGRREAHVRARELLELMGVAPLGERRPAELSGGEQQRVGVARALARRAGLLLLDEPTAHLDASLRAALLGEIEEQRRRSGAGALYATHDVAEALAIADRVALLRGGEVIQVGTPRQVYEQPVDVWAARLSGPASVLEAELLGHEGNVAHARIGAAQVRFVLASSAAPPSSGPVSLLVRPDWAALDTGAEATVTTTWFRGPHTDYRLQTGAGSLELRAAGSPRVEVGARVGWRLERAWLLAERPA